MFPDVGKYGNPDCLKSLKFQSSNFFEQLLLEVGCKAIKHQEGQQQANAIEAGTFGILRAHIATGHEQGQAES